MYNLCQVSNSNFVIVLIDESDSPFAFIHSVSWTPLSPITIIDRMRIVYIYIYIKLDRSAKYT